jgi:hypothetical protein
MNMGFRVGKGGGWINGVANNAGTTQLFTPPSPLNYVDVTWPYQVWDRTGWFDFTNGVWLPQSSGLAIMNWGLWDSAGVYTATAGNVTAKLIGVDSNGINKGQDASAIGDYDNSNPHTSCMAAGVSVLVAAGDVWRIANYCRNTSGQQVAINSDNAHTWWSCAFFPD